MEGTIFCKLSHSVFRTSSTNTMVRILQCAVRSG